MTPKEKAENLYNRMVVDFQMDKWQSRECALITVDEVIEAINSMKSLTNNYLSQTYETAFINLPSTSFWEEVKKEIQNI
jgi:hypothetical protein